MTYDNRGALWANKQKDPAMQSQRDFQGNISIDGKEYWLSGWNKKDSDAPNAPIIRLSAQLKEPIEASKAEKEPEDWEDDKIPF